MHTVVETPFFSKLWPRYWYEVERGTFAAFVAGNPEAGDVVPGTGGLRKVLGAAQAPANQAMCG